MAVKAGELNNPERDLELRNRAGAGAAAPPLEPRRGNGSAAGGDLEQLRGRIDQARKVKPSDKDLRRRNETHHCLDCFERGRDAALRVIDSGE